MKRQMDFTGGELRCLVHHHSRPLPDQEDASNTYYQNCLRRLVALELLQPADRIDGQDTWVTTERGRVHVEALCRAPLPEKVWRSPLLAD